MSRFILFLCICILPVMVSGGEAGESIAHISYLEGNVNGKVKGHVKIIRLDKQRDDAIVNLPVMPGDRVVTGKSGRCEILFPGGTLLRVGERSQVQIESLSARPYKGDGSITTLKLDSGQVYVSARPSSDELFQVITPNAAAVLHNRSVSIILFDRDDGTVAFVREGAIKMIYGKKSNDIKYKFLPGGTGGRVTRGHVFKGENNPDREFLRWNEALDKDSSKLHHGPEALPHPIDRYSRPVRRFMERWSTLYGEWKFDDWLGYVWKPYPETLSRSLRPFPGGETRKINGFTFFVPKEKWGWVPAHRGAWIWKTNGGWHWIPGSNFTMNLTTIGDWIEGIYGSNSLYKVFRKKGKGAWRRSYKDKLKRYLKAPELEKVPEPIKKMIVKLNRIPLKMLQHYSLFPTL